MLDAGGESLSFEAEDVLVESESAEGYSSAEEGGYLVGLDTRLTEALKLEGLAREVVRTVQDARKQAGLEVSDRIRLRIGGSGGVQSALDAHRGFIMSETLPVAWGDDEFPGGYSVDHDVDGQSWTIQLEKVNG